MKNMKNTFRLFLLFVFCFFSLNIKAYETIGYLKYNLSLTASDTTACVIGYSNSQKSMVIPDKVTYNGCQYKVTAIADEAFRSCGMEEITIGKYIQRMGRSSTPDFIGCSNLKKVIWKAQNCQNIGNYYYSPFYNSDENHNAPCAAQITTIEFTDDVEAIPEYLCLGMTNLQIVRIGKNVKSIGRSNSSYFQNIYITDLLAFCGISVDGNYPSYRLYLNNVELTSLAIPQQIATIYSNTFNGCMSIASVSIHSGVSLLPAGAFCNCPNLQTVYFKAQNCEDASDVVLSTSVTNIQFDNNVKRIPNHLCEGTSITSITIPEKVEYIGQNAFYKCLQLQEVVWNAMTCDFTEGLNSTGGSSYSAINQIRFGNKVQIIPDNLCKNLTSLTNVSFPSSLTHVGDKAFYFCTGLSNVNIVSSNISIGKGAFAYCSGLTRVSFAEGLTKIADKAFYYCENLTSINLPSTLTDIGEEAFYKCSAWRVVLPDSLVHIGANAIYNTFTYNLERNWSNGVLYVGSYLIQGLDSKGLGNNYSIQDGTILIADGAFSGSKKLTSTSLPNSVRYIGNRAFYNCSKMGHDIQLPQHVEVIGDSAMYFESTVQSDFTYTLTLPKKISYIGKNAFYDSKAKINAIYAYMHIPPMIDSQTFSLVNSMANTPIYVYADDINTYFTAEVWNQFDIQAISAPTVNVNDSVILDISRTDVTFSWQKINQASIYELAVSLVNGDTIEVVKFNGQGEIKSDDRKQVKSNYSASQGYQYTISGLENNTTYAYLLRAKNSSGKILKEYSDSFITGQRYTVKFVDWDNSLLKQEIVREREAATPPGDPVREGYTFTGWDKSYTDIRNNTTIKATYSINIVYYTVTFLDWDGTELYVEQVEEGHDAIGPVEEPTREGYIFIGWSKPLTDVRNDLIVVAQYQLSEGLKDVLNNNDDIPIKVMHEGQVYIFKNNKTYTLIGQEVK